MAATAANVSDLRLDDSESSLRWYFPVPESAYAFCGTCGSSLFWQSSRAPERISICAGTLDLPTGLTTVRAWWTDEASDYHERQAVEELATE
jgi:hypothetical protein